MKSQRSYFQGKTWTQGSFLNFIFFFIFFSSVLFAATLPDTDNFNSSSNGWSGGTRNNNQYLIYKDTTGSKTYDFGSAYANAQVTIDFDYNLVGGWESGATSTDHLYITANGVTFEQSFYGSGSNNSITGSISTITATLDASGRLTLSVNPNTTGSGENVYIDNVYIASSNTPPSATINSALDITAAGGTAYTIRVTYHDPDGKVNASSIGTNDLSISGLSLASATIISGSGTDTTVVDYTFTPPGGSWDDADNGNYTITLGSGAVSDTNGASVASIGGDTSFIVDIPMTLTCTPLRDTATLDGANTNYNNNSFYNNSDWNVGPNSTGGVLQRPYKILINSLGDVTIALSRVDNNQARFSVGIGSCPTSFQGHSTLTLNNVAAGTELYILIYYINGTNTNIEHRLDVDLAVAQVPAAYPDTATTDIGEPIGIDVAANDVSVYSDSVSIKTQPLHGIISAIQAGGVVVYQPDSTYEGTDSFVYTINSPNGILEATVTITMIQPATQYYQTNYQPFELVNPYAQNVVGDYKIAGNTVMCLTDHSTTYGGTCQDANYAMQTSNLKISKYIDIDGDASTWNSTSSYINIPASTYDPSRGIVWAGLFWQGRISTDTDYPMHYGIENGTGYNLIEIGKDSSSTVRNNFDIRNVEANLIRLKIDNGAYNQVQAKTVYSYSSSNGTTYAAFANVTRYLQEAGLGAGDHTFTVANLTTNEGRESTPGVFGGWSLVVIYLEDLLYGEARNISIYNGFVSIGTNTAPIPISGFKLPKAGDISAQLSVFSGEGEYLYGYNENDHNSKDTMEISDQETSGYSYMPGATNDKNIFDGRLDGILRAHIDGQSNDLQVNNDGVDIDTYDVSDKMEEYRDRNENVDEIFIKLYSNNDYITPSMVAFSAQLYVPRLCYDYNYRQNGYSYTEDNNGSKVPYIDIKDNSGGPIDVKILIRSMDSDVDFSHVSIYSDMNLSKVKYQPGHFSKTEIGASYYMPVTETTTLTCNEGSSTASSVCYTSAKNFRAGLGRNTTGYPLANAGSFSSGDEMRFTYTLMPQNHDPLSTPLDLYVDIQYALADGSGGDLAPVYGIPLGDPRRMTLCPPNPYYMPEWGIFNAIDAQINRNRTGQSGNEYFNNLLTQVSARPFTIDVVSLDASENPPTKPQDRNTSVSVEIFDASEMHDINNTCNDQDTNLVLSRIVHLNFSENNRLNVPDMTSNSAIESAALRIWYMHDGNTSHLISNWTATTDSNGNLLGISNLYNQIPNAPTYCSAECATNTSVNCYNCLKKFFGYALCSRDNFAIRPESYHVLLQDQNLSDPLDLGFDIRRNSDANATARLSAGYLYNLDINATNHRDNNNTSGYKQTFQNASPATLQLMWQEPAAVTCNDENNVSIDALLTNGMGTDIRLQRDNVGLYSLQMRDTIWTAADQGVQPHHTAANFFITNVSDCRPDATLVSDDNLTGPYDIRKVGCIIATPHTVDTQLTNRTATTYQDMNISFHPYALSLNNLTLSHGSNFDTNFTAPPGRDLFLYMAALSEENNTSINAVGTIAARGNNGVILTNYTGNCYAEDINLTLNNTLPACDPNMFGYSFFNVDNNGTVLYSDNLTSNTVSLSDTNFTEPMAGTMNIRLHYNYDRNVTTPMNPKRVNIIDFSVDCNQTADCTISVDKNNNYDYGQTAPLDSNITFIYGRTHSPRYRINGSDGNATQYYEVYWDGNAACNLNNLLTTPIASVDSIDWYQNVFHDTAANGSITGFTPRNAASFQLIALTHDTNTSRGRFQLQNNIALPYKTTINVNAPSWLIYNRFDSNATANSFDIEFVGNGNIGGKGNAAQTNEGAAPNANKRIMW